MVNSKNKGSGYERDLVKHLNEKVNAGNFKRIPGSGAIGTNMGESMLTGDITGKVSGLPKPLKIEAKVGYGGEKQLAFKREWLNKIMQEAQLNYSMPVVICKFSGARRADGVQEFVALDIDTFIYLLNLISDLDEELKRYQKEK